ncbi:MAG: thymidine phosphorylase [Pseudomonadota bacterium]
MLPQEIVRKKRDGGTLDTQDIEQFVRGISDGSITEGQISALAMAVFFQGMSPEEIVALTLSMRDSGTVLTWPDLDGPVLDKHSTGGVGDNVSLMLAPAVAACGGYVPMISGRGLGHTGGTLDKLDSIAGYTTQPDEALFRKVTKDVGCAIIGQTADLAPADKRFYGIRDVTATVESVPLITASILSKKLAAGLDGLVLDVKCGNGAFMASQKEAVKLAKSLVRVSNLAGVTTSAILTDMSQPLASAAGNAVEVTNAIEFLTGRSIEPRLWDVTVALGADMLVSGGLVEKKDEARSKIEDAFTSGRAAELFAKMVVALGGPADILDQAHRSMPAAPIVQPVFAEEEGFVIEVETRAIGVAVVALGGGRMRAADPVDHSVGVNELVAVGDRVDGERPLAVVHAQDEAAAAQASAAVRAAYRLGDLTNIVETPTLIERITA